MPTASCAARSVHKCVHAACRYSCISPPRRSRRWTRGGRPIPVSVSPTAGFGGCSPERPVRTVGVVVLDIDPKDLLEVATADDQQPVQALGAHRPDPALRMGVGVGAGTGVSRTSAPSAQNTSSKLRVNFASWSRSSKHSRRSRSPECHQQVAGLLGNPGAGRVGGHPSQVDPPRRGWVTPDGIESMTAEGRSDRRC
jgi:hypothetical protein